MAATDANVTAVAASTSEAVLIAANSGRKRMSVYYDGAAVLYVVAGSETASSSLFTVKMGDGYVTYWEPPEEYRGPVHAVWSAAVGSAQVTEYA